MNIFQTFHKKQVAFILAAITVVCFILILSLFIAHKGKHALACGKSKYSSSTTVLQDFATGAEISFSVWHDSCTNSDYASANVFAGLAPNLSVAIFRDDNLDSRIKTNCPSSGVCESGEMPLNGHKAYASIDTQNILNQTSSF